jgi:hypothetical protein
MLAVHEAPTRRLVTVQDAHPDFFKLNKVGGWVGGWGRLGHEDPHIPHMECP